MSGKVVVGPSLINSSGNLKEMINDGNSKFTMVDVDISKKINPSGKFYFVSNIIDKNGERFMTRVYI